MNKIDSRHDGANIPINTMLIANQRAPSLGDIVTYRDTRRNRSPQLKTGVLLQNYQAPHFGGRYPRIFEKEYPSLGRNDQDTMSSNLEKLIHHV